MDQNELRALENQCIQECAPECTAACPVHVDVRALCANVVRGDFKAALKVLRKTIPFPGIIGRICDHPCQTVCKRNEVGTAISIAALERACADLGEAGEKIQVLPARGKSAAIVGGGLSGLTAAYDLARKGYSVVLYEKEPQLGGRLRTFSETELPRDVLEKETRVLERLGVTIHTGVHVGSDVSLDELLREHGAVYLAAGKEGGGAFELAKDENGRVRIDPLTYETGREGLFAGGSLCRETYSPIQSVADGRRAATSMDRCLQKVSLSGSRTGEGSYKTRLFTSTEGIEPLPAVTPALPERGYSEEEAGREAARCLQCECLECVKVCEFLRVFKAYPKKYIREVYNNLSIVMGMHHANKFINTCSICGLCKEVCPEDLHMGLVCRGAREEMVKKGKMPPSAHDFPVRDMLFSNSDKFATARHQPGTTESRYLFFPGCQLAASAPDHVRSAYLLLTERLSGGVGLMLRCCGAPAQWSGRTDLFEAAMEELTARWREMGRPEMIPGCSTCCEMIRTHRPEIPVRSLYEVLDELGEPKKETAAGRTVAVHDACTGRHEAKMQQSVRNIVRRSGAEIEELRLTGQKTECCGYGGLMMFANPEVASEVVRRRIVLSPLDYVAYCAMCRDNFAARGKRAQHVLDLVFGSPEDDSASRKGPGYSQRHENRTRLKDSLLEELWGERAPEREAYGMISLTISDELLERMEQRQILVEDLQRVILNAESTGNRLMDRKSGHYLAHWKPNSVTYWVEYSPREGGFVVHNAYSHRMEIFEEGKA